MNVIILAGGFGTRLSEYTQSIPKPMVPIGGHPIIWHIMNTYSKFNHNDFYIALGYKSEVIKEYFLNYRSFNSDFTVDLSTGIITPHHVDSRNWKVTLVDTGPSSMTGGRVKRMQKFIGKEPFMLTYGDGLANIDLDALFEFHHDHGKLVTVTAVHPGARFGELNIDNGQVMKFQEKPQMDQGWINGGFFIMQPDFFDLLDGDETILERSPLEKAASMGQLMAYKHNDFWQCMDTQRDRDLLEELWVKGVAPWRI